MAPQTHALFGSYDRYLFDPDGNLCKNATYLDARKVMIKMNTNYLDIDHMAARHEVTNPTNIDDKALFPVVRIEEGRAECFDYNIRVYALPQLSKKTKFVHISRWNGSEFDFFGGIASLVTDLQGRWLGISKETVDAYMTWSLKEYYNIVDGYGHYFVEWLNKCRTSASIQQSKSTVQVLADALKTQEELKALTGNKQPTLNFPATTNAPEPEAEPVPIPLEGTVADLGKVPAGLVELV